LIFFGNLNLLVTSGRKFQGLVYHFLVFQGVAIESSKTDLKGQQLSAHVILSPDALGRDEESAFVRQRETTADPSLRSG
jgi:hypothetical protein